MMIEFIFFGFVVVTRGNEKDKQKKKEQKKRLDSKNSLCIRDNDNLISSSKKIVNNINESLLQINNN